MYNFFVVYDIFSQNFWIVKKLQFVYEYSYQYIII